MIGVYAIRNKINNKHYIGLSVDIKSRFRLHKFKLGHKIHPNKHFQKSVEKYGIENFEFLVLEICKEEELSDREIYYINFYNSKNSHYGYNKTEGGSRGKLLEDIVKSTANKLRGRKLSEEMKERIRKTLTGRKQTQKAIDNRAKSCTKHTQEFKQEIFDYYLENKISRINLAVRFNINFHTLCSFLKINKIRKNGKTKKKDCVPWRNM